MVIETASAWHHRGTLMKRRQVLAGTALGVAALASTGAAHAGSHGRTGFILVHGSWHGGWCWSQIAFNLRNAGHLVHAVDLPGSGIGAVSPPSFFQRPLDLEAFASEPSQFSVIPSSAFAETVLDAAAQLRASGVDKVVAVGHSMGGMPITLAAAQDPSAIQSLVFLTALTTVPGKPSGAYLGVAEQADTSELNALVLADPAKIGAIRVDPASSNAAYNAAFKEAAAADVPEDLWRTAVNMMNPDAPAAIYGDVIDFPPDYANIDRTYIRCTKDKVLVPAAQDAMIADLNATWPDNPCKVIDLDTSHEAMFADPDGLTASLRTIA